MANGSATIWPKTDPVGSDYLAERYCGFHGAGFDLEVEGRGTRRDSQDGEGDSQSDISSAKRCEIDHAKPAKLIAPPHGVDRDDYF